MRAVTGVSEHLYSKPRCYFYSDLSYKYVPSMTTQRGRRGS